MCEIQLNFQIVRLEFQRPSVARLGGIEFPQNVKNHGKIIESR